MCKYKFPKGKKLKELIVPKPFRLTAMKIAHEEITAGHLGTRTTDRILEEFYWPGLQSVVKRFVRSLDLCYSMVSISDIRKVALGNVPIIEMPFESVGTDITDPFYLAAKAAICTF